MNKLMVIGALLLIVGLLIFSLRLMAYNRKKYHLEETVEELKTNYINSSFIIRILSIIIFLVALLIFAFGS
ncbi:MAG: hypothetical protein HQ528_04745 [Candidatus Marinimicrobia bacterium]|nr:hypothetical protein [Candidatus Neomarinimicrobiota bacterium]